MRYRVPSDGVHAEVQNDSRLLLLNESDLRRVSGKRPLNMAVSSGVLPSSPPKPPVIIQDAATNTGKKSNQGVTAEKRQTIQAAGTKQKTRNKVQKCCFHNSRDLNKDFTTEFFEAIRETTTRAEWTGNEYEEWLQLSSQLSSNNDCKSQWELLVLNHIKYRGEYLRLFMTQLSQGYDALFPFYPEQNSKRPRVLFLGDSISRAVWVLTQRLYNRLGVVAMYGAPTNCRGFDEYEASLIHWLGSCPWDVVQFNVGMHFSPTLDDWRDEYADGIWRIVSVIRAHSPQARIIFALTTPSPFDSPATIPDEATCPNYHQLHKAGVVSSMNDVARSLSDRLGILINDRYSTLHPFLSTYQEPCNVHLYKEGYFFLARHDWKFLSSHLNITVPNRKPKATTPRSTISSAVTAIKTT